MNSQEIIKPFWKKIILIIKKTLEKKISLLKILKNIILTIEFPS